MQIVTLEDCEEWITLRCVCVCMCVCVYVCVHEHKSVIVPRGTPECCTVRLRSGIKKSGRCWKSLMSHRLGFSSDSGWEQDNKSFSNGAFGCSKSNCAALVCISITSIKASSWEAPHRGWTIFRAGPRLARPASKQTVVMSCNHSRPVLTPIVPLAQGCVADSLRV